MQVSVGHSNIPISENAGLEAVRQAVAGAGRAEPCDMIMLFCTARHDQKVLRTTIARVVGEDTPIYGGAAVGVITNEYYGYQTTMAIRQLSRADAKTVPIIAMTANAYREDVNHAIESGMNGHLSKPVDIDAVKKLLYDRLYNEIE